MWDPSEDGHRCGKHSMQSTHHDGPATLEVLLQNPSQSFLVVTRDDYLSAVMCPISCFRSSTPGVLGHRVLPETSEEERERVKALNEALKDLPALERRLDKIEIKLALDKRTPGWDRQAEALEISECLCMLQQNRAVTEGPLLEAEMIGHMQVGWNWRAPSTCLPSCKARFLQSC